MYQQRTPSRIKRKEYMLYALQRHNEWMEAKEDAAKRRLMGENCPDPVKPPIATIRKDWERINRKSIYI